MAIKLHGVDSAIAALTTIKRETPKAAIAALEVAAKDMAALARDYAPTDRNDLVKSIRALRVQDSNGARWRIKVGGMQGSRDVDAYAKLVHETFRITHGGETRGPPRTNPGKRSRAKAKALGVGVGGKFLARAFKDLMPQIELNMANAIKQSLRRTTRKTSRKKK